MTLKTMEKKALAKAGAWNAKYPVGTLVRVTRDDGIILEKKTLSVAWVASCMAIIKVEGISGGYSLDRVKAIP